LTGGGSLAFSPAAENDARDSRARIKVTNFPLFVKCIGIILSHSSRVTQAWQFYSCPHTQCAVSRDTAEMEFLVVAQFGMKEAAN
jgi:hypothetical protein